MRDRAASCAAGEVPAHASSTTYTLYPSASMLSVGQVMQTSVHSPDRRMFFLPVAWTASRNAGVSHEFMPVRSIGVCSGNTSSSCGHIGPLNDSVSTAVRTAGTLNSLATLARRVTLLIRDARSMFATPKSICGW